MQEKFSIVDFCVFSIRLRCQLDSFLPHEPANEPIYISLYISVNLSTNIILPHICLNILPNIWVFHEVNCSSPCPTFPYLTTKLTRELFYLLYKLHSDKFRMGTIQTILAKNNVVLKQLKDSQIYCGINCGLWHNWLRKAYAIVNFVNL